MSWSKIDSFYEGDDVKQDGSRFTPSATRLAFATLQMGAKRRQILQHVVMRKQISRLRLWSSLALLAPCCAVAEALSNAPLGNTQPPETASTQDPSLCDLKSQRLPIPPTPDIVAEQLRLTIELTEDAALQRKLRSAYLHYLGCLSNSVHIN